MKAKDLKKGHRYYYTAGCEWVAVTYLYETINGYMFEADSKMNVLNEKTVESYISEL